MSGNLPDAQRKAIEEIIDGGDEYLHNDEFHEAEQLYRRALAMIPNPKHEHTVALQAFIGLGESLLFAGKHDEALDAFQQAMKAPGGFDLPLVAFRVGQSYYLGDNRAAAANAFGRAVMLGGDELFAGEENKEYRPIVAPLLQSDQEEKG